jgi:hypothetical protein
MVRGRKRPIPKIQKEAKFSIHNRFDVEIIDSITGEIKQKAFAENIVLNSLWTRLFAPNTYFNYIHYGTGTGTLLASRTSLFTFLGAKSVIDAPDYGEQILTYDWVNGWVSSRKKIQIAPEENVGSEFKEVGIGYSATATNLVTHALLKDMNGNTITIVKTNTDVINIYATVFVHWNTEGYGGATVWANRHNTFVTRFLTGDYHSVVYTSLANIHTSPGGVFSVYTDVPACPSYPTVPTYNTGAKTISISKRLGVNDSNGPIRVISVDNNYKDPAIICEVGGTWFQGTEIFGEALGTGDGSKTAFKTAYGRIKPGAKVYVDGAEQTTGVTITTGLPNVKTTFGAMFDLVSSTNPNTGQQIDYPSYVPEQVTGRNMTETSIYFNPYSQYGISSLYVGPYAKVDFSSDGVTWDYSTTYDSAYALRNIPAEHRTKPYIQFAWTSGSSHRAAQFTADTLPEFDVNFTTPPANGAVVTIDYETESIAKDTNHVFDFSLEITLGEKTD